MSGLTLKYSDAPPHPSFAPVFTSSKISSAPFLVAMSRSPSRKPGCGMHRPTFIRIGSRMMAAISPGFCLKRSSTLARSLKVAMGTLAMADFRHAQSAGDRNRIMDVAEFGCVRLHADQRGIVQAVISTFELDDLVAAGSGASQADRRAWWLPCRCCRSAPSRPESAGRFLPPVPIPCREACRTWCRCSGAASTAFITAGWQCPAIIAPKQRL